jgi:hypothetical protein
LCCCCVTGRIFQLSAILHLHFCMSSKRPLSCGTISLNANNTLFKYGRRTGYPRSLTSAILFCSFAIAAFETSLDW